MHRCEKCTKLLFGNEICGCCNVKSVNENRSVANQTVDEIEDKKTWEHRKEFNDMYGDME